jgi:hypothetical protein
MAELAVADATCVEEVDDAVGVVPVAGVGGASERMNIAKLVMSDAKSDDGLALGVGSVKFVVSSGVGLNAHPGVSSLSIKQLVRHTHFDVVGFA